MNKNEKEKLRSLWKERIDNFRKSKLTMKKYCEAHNLKVHQLQYWNRKFSTNTQSKATNWVAVNLNNNSLNNNNQPIYLNIGSCKIEINHGFNHNLLKELLKVLNELC